MVPQGRWCARKTRLRCPSPHGHMVRLQPPQEAGRAPTYGGDSQEWQFPWEGGFSRIRSLMRCCDSGTPLGGCRPRWTVGAEGGDTETSPSTPRAHGQAGPHHLIDAKNTLHAVGLLQKPTPRLRLCQQHQKFHCHVARPGNGLQSLRRQTVRILVDLYSVGSQIDVPGDPIEAQAWPCSPTGSW